MTQARTAPGAGPPYDTDDARWQAVAGRDARARGAFVYAVAGTGVFCHPGCASRLPRREGVSFFETPDRALAAGYRPCKRCRPDATGPSAPDARLVEACRIMERAEEPPTAAELARMVGLSPAHFQRRFKARLGLTPKEYALALREGRLREALARGTGVTRAILDAGYGSPSRFYEKAPQILGMHAGAFRRGGRGEAIGYALGRCSLGSFAVAATARGLCALELGDDADALRALLVRRFRHAASLEHDPALEEWAQVAAAFLDEPARGLDLPLDILGTAFQHRVWRALTHVPPGTTTTYSALARALGLTGGARAVAGAVAANPLAVAIPCHRVLRADGSLAGYRWGTARKKALLDREAKDEGP